MPTKLIKPKALRTGGQIGIVSPARHAAHEVITGGKTMLENMGFKVFVHPQNSEKDFQLAGSDEARAEAIMDMFQDSSIEAILAPRGGIGSYRVAPHLNYEVIAAHPKIFCGFSDLTTLLLTIQKRTGLVTFHGPLLMNFIGDHDVYNLNFLTQMLTGRVPVKQPVDYPEARSLRDGVAEGRLVGGNITLLQHVIGTKDDFNTDGAVLFLEDDAGEKLSDIDRKLWHFKNAGKFQRITGLLVGEFRSFRNDDAGAWGHDIPALLNEVVPSHIPIAYNAPCAHGRKITTLPLGIEVRLEISGKGVLLSYLENPFA